MSERTLEFSQLKDFFSELVRELEKVVPYASGLAMRRQGTRVSVSTRQSAANPESPSQGAVLTLWNGSQFYELSDNRLEPGALRREALALARRAAAEAAGGDRKELDLGEPLEKDFAAPAQKDPLTLPLKEKLAYARKIQESLQACGLDVSNAVGIVSDQVFEEVFVNRARRLSQRLPRVEEAMQVFVAEAGQTRYLWDGRSRSGGYENLGFCLGRSAGLVDDTRRLLKAGRLEPGFYDVVTDQEWSGMLAHEAFGHGTETDMYLKDRAMGKLYQGKKVASDITSLWDDPSREGQSGTFFFDDEGALAGPNKIIDQGSLVSGMTDWYSSTYLGLRRTANGRRESWERKAYARMTNTFFAPGNSKPAELISSVQDGWYLRYASNGMEDPQGWGIQCEGLWAQRIREGKLTQEVCSPVILTGFVPDILSSISLVADDLDISGLGMCGKGHKEYVKNTMGGPHLKFRARLA
jgi:TldD protein